MNENNCPKPQPAPRRPPKGFSFPTKNIHPSEARVLGPFCTSTASPPFPRLLSPFSLPASALQPRGPVGLSQKTLGAFCSDITVFVPLAFRKLLSTCRDSYCLLGSDSKAPPALQFFLLSSPWPSGILLFPLARLLSCGTYALCPEPVSSLCMCVGLSGGKLENRDCLLPWSRWKSISLRSYILDRILAPLLISQVECHFPFLSLHGHQKSRDNSTCLTVGGRGSSETLYAEHPSCCLA